MTMTLQGRTAIVTGGGSGLGAGIAERLAREGAPVLVADINADTATAVAAKILSSGGQAAAFRMDVTQEVDCAAAVVEAEARFGPLRIAVCNAGITDRSPLLDMPFEAFEKVVRTNLFGCFLSGRAAARAMVRAKPPGGRIVMTSSVSGQLGGTGRVAYGASKGGIQMLVKVFAVELAAHGILVNGIAPGPVRIARTAHGPRQEAAFLDRMAIKRYGTPADIAGAVAFLCGDDCGFVTGHILNADGGFAAGGVLYDPSEGP
jgi:3-oxoacyl-[acyl-carrier protein] reductase